MSWGCRSKLSDLGLGQQTSHRPGGWKSGVEVPAEVHLLCIATPPPSVLMGSCLLYVFVLFSPYQDKQVGSGPP